MTEIDSVEIPVVASPEISRRRRRLLLGALGSVASACALLGLMAGSGYAGFSRGLSERPTRSSGANAQDPAYLVDQYQRCIDAISAANGPRAQAYCEEVLRLQPGNKGAQELRATALAIQIPATLESHPPPIRVQAEDKKVAFEQFQSALASSNWDVTINYGEALRALDKTYERATVEAGLYKALVTRGGGAINKGELEAGLFDFEVAAEIKKLDDRTEGMRVVVSLYQDAQYFYGADWDGAISKYRQVYAASPGFRDTARKLYESYWRSGEENDARRDYCQAEKRYTSALQLFVTAEIQAKHTLAQTYCLATPPILLTAGPGTSIPVAGTSAPGSVPLGYASPTPKP